ncbi:phosphatase PAP2 family protein [Nocardioides aurantiacus]|uniref:Membrane-associated phospholipid phosphatase n=1 Tax=Nocardioides aurantiacus TaxID=86796 RepID=A0A3N2CRZ5_9ACTN|nr:phosphatase PAP2 family protein [Nocardioides aurantiacus]ROR90295.1 membrane-associated phospholipid phosphatase [Nocardioides aurantiacus]
MTHDRSPAPTGRGRDVRRDVRRGVLLAVVAALALAGVYAAAVLTPEGQYLDDRLMVWAADTLPGRGTSAELLALVSAGTVLLAGLALGLLALAVHGPRRALAVVATVGATPVLARLLKLLLDRPELVAGAAGNSLPSGHTAAVAGLAAGLVLAVPRLLNGTALLAGTAAAAVAGAATVMLRWHRPSDVVAAVLLAAVVGGIAHALAPPARRPPRRTVRSREHPTRLDDARTDTAADRGAPVR